MCQYIVQYLSVEERNRLQCVSKQFQRTVFAAKIRLDINLYDLDGRTFFERFRHILKYFPNIESINISGFVRPDDGNVKRLFDGIHYFCNKSIKFDLRVEYLSEELMQRFVTKFGSNIIELIISKPIHKIFASIKELNVEKFIVCKRLDLSLNEIQFKRLKNLKIEILNTQDLDPLEVFIKRNKHNIKHLEISIWNETNGEKTRLLNIISNLSNLVELKLDSMAAIYDIKIDINDKTVVQQLTRIANKCKELKSIGISFRINSKNTEDMNELVALLRQFKRLRRLRIKITNSNEMNKLFSFKVFKGLENITHLSIQFSGNWELFSETTLH